MDNRRSLLFWPSSDTDQDQKDHFIYHSENTVHDFDPFDLDPFLKIAIFIKGMEYAKGASAYALSNASMLLCSSLLGSLEVRKYLRKYHLIFEYKYFE
jgi:hypothetical protein